MHVIRLQPLRPKVSNENSHVVRYLLNAIRRQEAAAARAWEPTLARLTPRSRVLQRSPWYARRHAVGLLQTALARVSS